MNRDQAYLLDIADACNTLLEFVEGMNLESFITDKRTHLAVLYEITVIGEVVKRLSGNFRTNHPEIPWRQIAGMRDKLIHDYNQVDLTLTWEVTQSSIPQLYKFVLVYLSQQGIYLNE
ncbi:DUF86 domain-containing protein [Thermosynechococcaceae cyanobacterium BACA0444]|uniref:DUF86 domain-containing protein n=1 Tax=Pseudocalidococcus azoricus BACA0444 TaxID=2918990 RepID=A0AAE4FQI0_9CYAN|nr:DUF86 domain-containing protein [Pseudocalidococcus azoricus]MDS3859657.1 DUF86 domain-containing protein [Pseudocalidococcus azoricus BACA0444]